MVPFDGIVPRLRRAVRQAAEETGKRVELQLDRAHGELDRSVLDHMVAPIEHMLRNSVAHGIEAPEARRAAGKAEEGTIRLRMRREGSNKAAGVRRRPWPGPRRDPPPCRGARAGGAGAGADRGRAGRADHADRLQHRRERQAASAGRGVGMDVVRNEVLQLGGSVEIASVDGQGVTFTPCACRRRWRSPRRCSCRSAKPPTRCRWPRSAASAASAASATRPVPAATTTTARTTRSTTSARWSATALRAEGQAQVPLLLVRAGDLHAAVAIDQVLGNREIVVKSVGPQIASVPGIYGATITGEGEVVVILDVAPLVRRHLTQPERPQVAPQAVEARHVPLVMVVDDPLTMRKVTGRVLERNNFEVVTARDGVEALERLEERCPT